jgi:glutamate racemase
MDGRPIGIFDSGVGGLSVCKAIRTVLPSEDIIYFGDTGRFPYGTRAIDTVIRYSEEITAYLKSKDVKIIVIACNTASAAALETLKSKNSMPVIGVIDTGARAACKRVKDNLLGVIGTRATVESGSYIKAIKSIMPEVNILQQHASLLVSLTEEGWIDEEITRLAAEKYIRDMYNKGVRTLILGCTHFPLLKKAINDVFPDMDLVDTGEEIALEVKNLLSEKNIEKNNGAGNITLLASDITETILHVKDMFFGEDTAQISKLVINAD